MKISIQFGPQRNYYGFWNNVAYCPSMRRIMTPGDDCWDHRMGYGFPAFGVFYRGQGFGTTHLTRFAGGGKGYGNAPPGHVVTIWDTTYTPLDAKWGDRNHNRKGGNITAGNGAGKWLALDQFQLNRNIDGVVRPWSYYVQDKWGNTSTGMFAVFYPNRDDPVGYNHQPEYWGQIAPCMDTTRLRYLCG